MIYEKIYKRSLDWRFNEVFTVSLTGYIPSAVEQSSSLNSNVNRNNSMIPNRTNKQPPGGGTHGLFNSPSTNEDDDLSKRKAKQLEYQEELKRQVSESLF